MAGMRDIRVCVFGDSFAAGVGDPRGVGWVGRLAARAREVELTAYPLGVRGESTEEIVVRIPVESAPRFARGDEHRIVIAPGVADAVRRIEPVQCALALDFALASASVPVLIVGPPPVGDAETIERIGALDAVFARTCERRAVQYVATYPRLVGRATWYRARAADGIHPDGPGYGVLASVIRHGWDDWIGTTPASR
jgi:acyl-CoA thioesterase I